MFFSLILYVSGVAGWVNGIQSSVKSGLFVSNFLSFMPMLWFFIRTNCAAAG